MDEPLVRLRAALEPRYSVERVIGRGGMGAVLKGRDNRFNRPVAIKVMSPVFSSAIATHRFEREIQTAAQLQHPHILPVYDSGEAGGQLFFVTPFVEGESLRERIDREGGLPIEEAIRIAEEVAGALDFAHRQGVIHRDIKPGNILLTDGGALVADFGIAKTQDSEQRLTDSGVSLGTPAYMSPEQGSGDQEVGPATDVYALGCVLYEMLTGEPPFSGRTAQITIAKHRAATPQSVRILRPTVPPAVETAVAKALAKTPADRFKTAGEFARVLGEHRRYPVSSPPTTGLRRVLAATVFLVLLVGGWLVLKGAPVLRERDQILVADFSGPPGNPDLGGTFRELIASELDQSRYVRTVPRPDVNAAMRIAEIPETTFVDVELGRELAIRGSIRAVLVGAVEGFDEGRYSTVLHLVEAETGDNLVSVATTGQDLIVNAEQLGRDLRRAIGERRADIERTLPLRQAMTPSLPAFLKYLQALELENQTDIPRANTVLREALELDPEFAVAWSTMGARYMTARQLDSAAACYRRALELEHRLTAAQRYRARGDVAWTIDQDLDAAIRWYSLLVEEIPTSTSARNNRAVLFSSVGRYEEAVADLEAAVDLFPFSRDLIQSQLMNLAAARISIGRYEAAEETISDLGEHFAIQARILLAMARGEWADADSLSAVVEGDESIRSFLKSLGALAGVSSRAACGSVLESLEELQTLEIQSPRYLGRWYAHARLLLAMTSGAPLEPLSKSILDGASAGDHLIQGLFAASRGDTATASYHQEVIRGLDAAARRSLAAGPALLAGMLAARAGDWRSVTEELATHAREGEHDALALDRPSSFALRWAAAEAYERREMPDSALAFFEMARATERIPPVHYALRGIPWVFATYRIALLHRRMNDRQGELRELRLLRETLSQSDEFTSGIREEVHRRLNLLAGAP